MSSVLLGVVALACLNAAVFWPRSRTVVSAILAVAAVLWSELLLAVAVTLAVTAASAGLVAATVFVDNRLYAALSRASERNAQQWSQYRSPAPVVGRRRTLVEYWAGLG